MTADVGAYYDRVPYEGYAYAVSHPNSIAAAATLAGLQPPRLDKCRVLEIGCAAGANLIPIAECYPKSEFHGVDLSAVQIREANDFITTKHPMKNITFHHLSVADIPKSLGKFDYVICHGVFSWVPDDIQGKILEAASQFLAPNGLAYISYNVYPGWHWRATLRNLMSYHGDHFKEPEQRVKEARKFLDMLAASFPETNKSPFAVFLREESERMKKHRDPYVLHEYLEPFNIPVYFKDFMARADSVGLQYVAESRVQTMALGLLAKPIADMLRQMNVGVIDREQYIDIARNRTFRETILCHKDRTVQRRITAESIKPLMITCGAVTEGPLTDEDIRSNKAVKFKWGSGQTIDVSLPLFKAALHYLTQAFPRAVPFNELIEGVTRKTAGAGQPALTVANDGGLAGTLLDAFLRSLIELHFAQPPMQTKLTDLPEACPLARRQAESSDRVISRRHSVIVLAPFDRALIRVLDGTRDRKGIEAEVMRLIETGVLNIRTQDPEVLTSKARQIEMVNKTIDRSLEMFRRSSLLVA